MSVATLTSTEAAFAFYSRIGAALFPVPSGKKDPTGIVGSFKHDFSRDPALWSRWHAEHACNFGVVAYASHIILIDTDAGSDRAAAWATRCALFAKWGLPLDLMPHVATPSGGFHDYLALPEGVDGSTLIQPDAHKGVVQIRCRGFGIAAGSYWDGQRRDGNHKAPGHYALLSDATPVTAPPALIAICTPRTAPAVTKRAGEFAKVDVAAMLSWMAERDAFADYFEWVKCGMACRAEYGDDGLDLWQLTHDGSVTADSEATKWQSFADTMKPSGVTIRSLMKQAHALGWKGQLSKPGMFDGAIAQLAQSTGARRATIGTMPLTDTQGVIAALGEPILQMFLDGTNDAPNSPLGDYPKMPDATADYPLHDTLQRVIGRACAMAAERGFKPRRVADALGVLSAVHDTTHQNVVAWIRAHARVSIDAPFGDGTRRFERAVRKAVRSVNFTTDRAGNPDPKNSDNVGVFLREIKVRLRWNTWNSAMELSDSDGPWVAFQDHHYDALHTTANDGQFNYYPSAATLERAVRTIARETPIDPPSERLAELQSKWDGVPRLRTAMTQIFGVDCTPFYQAVGRNFFGGVVRRIRNPGCDQHEALLLMGPQGAGKGKFCKIVAMDPLWHNDSFQLNGTPQSILPTIDGFLIVEWNELAGKNKLDVETVKAFITTASDVYTKKYEKIASRHPRRFVFVCTSNNHSPLQDETGGRRFLPIQIVGDVNLKWLSENIDQIYGEAAHREAAGESFAIPPELYAIAAEHQEAARAISPIETVLESWFKNAAPSYITAADLTHMLTAARLHMTGKQYGPLMRRLGWHTKVARIDNKPERIWTNCDDAADAARMRTPLGMPLPVVLSPPLAPPSPGVPLPPVVRS